MRGPATASKLTMIRLKMLVTCQAVRKMPTSTALWCVASKVRISQSIE